jgi:oxygen-independent coproporphyrinogen-3 oxidase
MEDLALYVHIPFCQSRCRYCDFNTYAGLEGLYEVYAEALLREITLAGPARISTIYLGGGTPTVLPLSHLVPILDRIQTAFTVDPDAEVTIEANPGTVDARVLTALRQRGVNRLSLGMQSCLDEELRLLGRTHTAEEGAEAFAAARHAGFRNVGLDLIYGLPGQTRAAWRQSIERAIVLEPEHLSLYSLSLEAGTPLARDVERGHLPAPEPDLAAEMYEAATALVAAAGYLHYEISNWAKSVQTRCRHNLTYWRNEPYLGLGAGAHSWQRGCRWVNASHPAEYAQQIRTRGTALADEEWIPTDLEMDETMLMGLRLVDEGVSWDRFQRRFGLDARQRYQHQISDLVDLGLLEVDDCRGRLSTRGHLLGNQVFARFLL